MTVAEILDHLKQQGYEPQIGSQVESYNIFESVKYLISIRVKGVIKPAILKLYKDRGGRPKCLIDIYGYRLAKERRVCTPSVYIPNEPIIPSQKFLVVERWEGPLRTIKRLPPESLDCSRITGIAAELLKLHSIENADYGYYYLNKVHKMQGGFMRVLFSMFRNHVENVIAVQPAYAKRIEKVVNSLQGNSRVEKKLTKTKYEFLHGNLDLTNIVANAENNTFAGLIDWKYAFFGDRHYDLAYCFRWIEFLNKGMGKALLNVYEELSGKRLDEELMEFFDDVHNLKLGLIRIEEGFAENCFELENVVRKYA